MTGCPGPTTAEGKAPAPGRIALVTGTATSDVLGLNWDYVMLDENFPCAGSGAVKYRYEQ